MPVTRSKLTVETVVEVRERYAAGAEAEDLAKEFGVKTTAIRDAASGRSWKSAGGPITKSRPKPGKESEPPKKILPRPSLAERRNKWWLLPKNDPQRDRYR